MADGTYTPKVYRKQGGDAFVVASGGEIDVESGGALKIGGVALTGTAAELNKLHGVTASTAELNLTDGCPALCTVVTAAGAANVADTTITVKDAAGATLAKASAVLVWITDDADGLVPATGQDAMAVKAAGGTSLAILNVKTTLLCLTKADGALVISTTDVAKGAFYINVLPLAGPGVVCTGTIAAGTDYGA